MMRRVFGTLAAVAALSLTATPSAAQNPVQPGYMDIGPVVGLGGIGEAGIAFGGRFERGIKTLTDMGGGTLGIMVGVNYYTYNQGFGGFEASWTYIPIGVTANYHFNLEGNPKFDPFVGLGLGYAILSCDWPGSGFDPCDNSSIYFIGRAGVRYFYRPNMALYGDVGAGHSTLNIGLMFKLR
jgi:hypothetical protein